MQSSESIGALAAALSAAQGEFPVVEKKSNNPFFNSKYADLAEVVKATAPILAKHNLSLMQTVGHLDVPLSREATTTKRDGTVVSESQPEFPTTLTTTLAHSSGEWVRDTMVLAPVKLDPQAQGSAITYARRYAYSAILGIVTEADDDGNAASSPKAEAKEAEAPRPTRRAAPRPQQPEIEAISKPQLAKLAVQFKELTELGEKGFKERDERLEQVGALVGKKIASSNDLTKDEASSVIDLLDKQIASLKRRNDSFDEDF